MREREQSRNSETGEKVENSTGKVEVVKEEAFTTIPEQQLPTDYLKDYLKNQDELYKDGKAFKDLYWGDIPNDRINR